MSLSNVRPTIREMQGYTPGEQPKDRVYFKLNTNENPYPPSPKVIEALRKMDLAHLNLYPDPLFIKLRTIAAQQYHLPSIDWILAGNGSDDLLTIAVRTFVDQGGILACPDVTYSLYHVLANLQGAKVIEVPLTNDLDLPNNVAELAKPATLFFLARPNAPTGKAYSLEKVRQFCQSFKGIVWIDEAYADFADDSCLPLVQEFDNVVVSRTFSKSFSLAGARLGLAFAHPDLMTEMYKVKDSYNVNQMTQIAGIAALEDIAYMQQNATKIKQTRQRVVARLQQAGFEVLPSDTNFVLLKTKRHSAKETLGLLHNDGFLVRWFNQPRICDYLRVSMGTDEVMDKFLESFFQIEKC